MDLLERPMLLFCLLAVVGAAFAVHFWPPEPASVGVGDERARVVLAGEVRNVGPRSPDGWTLEVALERIDRRDFPDRRRIRLFVPVDHIADGPGADTSRDAHVHRPPALPGDRIEVFGRIERYPPRQFPRLRSQREAMAGRGIDARATALEPLVIERPPPGLIDRLIGQLAVGRATFEQRLLEGLGGQKAALAVALTTGNRRFLDPETAEPFRQTGTAHLLAISGLHLGVLAALLWWLCGWVANRSPTLLRRFGRRRVCGAAVTALLGCYVLAIGAPVSAVRAWVALTFGVAALLLMRPLCPLHALAGAAIALVAFEPAVVVDLGFQLSFSATLGILLFLRYRPPLVCPSDDPFADAEPRWKGVARKAGLFVGVSISATLATWPVVCAHFGEVALSGLVVNLVVTPLVSALIFPVLAAGAMLTAVIEPLGFALLDPSAGAVLLMGDLLAAVARLSGAQWVTGATPAWATAALALGALLAVTSRWERARLAAACAAIGIGLSPGLAPLDHERDQQLHVHFIPVGQGDATLIGFPDGTTMLVDGGGRRLGRDPGRFVVVPYLRRLGVDRLDWVVVTHADTDHLGGLFAVAERTRPRHFVFDAHAADPSLRHLRRRLATAGTKLHPIHTDLRRDIGGVRLDIVRPRVASRAQNDASLVTKLGFGPAAVLLPGDVEDAAEQWLVARKSVGATVLKAPHHGSKTSSSPRFLDAVRPDVAVVSAGRFSRFGHPHAQVLTRYRRRGVDVFETAFDGLVRVEVARDGHIALRTHGPPRVK